MKTKLSSATRKKLMAAARARWAARKTPASRPREKTGALVLPRTSNGSNGNHSNLQATSASIDQSIAAAVQKAGCKDLAAFQKLPVHEQNAFLANAKGDAAAPIANGTARNVPIGKVTPSPWNRDVETEAKANGEDWQKHVQSIREHGIIQPLIVWPKGDGFELIAGERRWRGGKAAGLTTVPIIVRTDLTATDVLELQTIENYQRKNLNPIEEAQNFRRLLALPDYTMARLCQKIGLEKNTVYGKLKLLELPPVAQTAVIEKRLPATHAELIARAKTPAEQKEALREILPKDGPVVSHTRAEEIMKEIRAKAAADEQWEIEVKAANLKGWKVFSPSEARSVMSYGHVYSSAYLDLSACCFEDPKRRTWETLLRNSDCQRFLVRCKDSGNIKVLVMKDAATAALAVAGYEWARKEKSDKSRRDKIERQFEERRNREQAYAEQIIGMVCANIERNSTGLSVITMVLRMATESFCLSGYQYQAAGELEEEQVTAILLRRKFEPDKEPVAQLAELNRLAGQDTALSLLVETMIFWTPHITQENANRRRRHFLAQRLRITVPTLEGICSSCGCTETAACVPPCSWTDKSKTKCTACAGARTKGGAK